VIRYSILSGVGYLELLKDGRGKRVTFRQRLMGRGGVRTKHHHRGSLYNLGLLFPRLLLLVLVFLHGLWAIFA